MLKRLFCTMLKFFLFVSSVSIGSNALDAWWLNARFSPVCSSQNVSVVLHDQCYVLLSEEMFSEVDGYDRRDMKNTDALLRVRFDKKYKNERRYYSVAVFSTPNGQTGRALIEATDANMSNIVDIKIRNGIPGFSALIVKNDKLIWTFCLYCNDYELLKR